jgi:hypothetical protein
MAFAVAMAELCWACGARSGMSDAFAFDGASEDSNTTGGGAAKNGTGAPARAGADGLAAAGAAGFGATSAFGGSAGVSHSGGAANASAGAGGAARFCGLKIDDMEDGTGRICNGEGRVGAWYEYNDGFGLQLPPQAPGSPLLPLEIPAGFGRSGRAMYSSHRYPVPFQQTNLEAWGAGIGVDLAFDGSTYRSYDARGLTGISFWVRSNLIKYYEVRINTTDVTPIAYGGTCPREYCGKFAQLLMFHSEWTYEMVPFTQLRGVSDTGEQLEFHRERLTNIQFLFVIYPPDANDGEIWVDEPWFTPGGPPPK